MKHVMVDLETLDTRVSAVVLTIGAVIFDETSVYDKFYINLDINEQVHAGRSISGGTLVWWMAQSPEARQAAFANASGKVVEALHKLAVFIPKGAEVWGNGAMFDNAILTSMYEQFGVERPWSYKNDRCYRTMRAQTKAMFPSADIDVEPNVAHNAVDDAMAQALSLQKMWHAIRTGGETE